MKVTLTVTKGLAQGRTYNFDSPDTFLVGRAKDCHLRLSSDDPYISRHHFILEICPPRCILKDLDSTNPPRVNGVIVQEQELQDGDDIEVGYTHLQVSISREINKVLCKKCGVPIPLAGEDSAPDLCDRCAPAKSVPGRSLKIECKCGCDLTDKANTDGRAAELLGQVEYSCYSCAQSLFQPDGLPRYEMNGYVYLKNLGKGGMGQVDLVYHEPTARLLALKKILRLSETDLVKRFERECRFTRELIHENLIRYVDSGISGKEPYLVMQYVTGGNLGDLLLERDEPLNAAEAVDFILSTLSGLEFMHKHKIVHRDIKPENVILMKTETGKVIPKITDFGLAKKYSESGGAIITQLGTALGTPIYVPPEQVKDARNVREPADIYSVGMTLYYLLTGQFPFNFPTLFELKQLQQKLMTAKSLGELLAKMVKAKQVKQPMAIVFTEEPIPIRQRNPNIHQKLGDVVDRSIKKDINQRYQTATEFRNELLHVMKTL